MTTRNYYKINEWVLHHKSDMWTQANPVGEVIVTLSEQTGALEVPG
ncbi:hypothetical protein OQZ33_13375 [Pedobacter sp. MC2016-05]|nr:hypothetical protein [Pedobacter sp. MC2016-05]MCX2475322.1 hypothetical protein [Pedobacter sp. MC2016-05]